MPSIFSDSVNGQLTESHQNLFLCGLPLGYLQEALASDSCVSVCCRRRIMPVFTFAPVDALSESEAEGEDPPGQASDAKPSPKAATKPKSTPKAAKAAPKKKAKAKAKAKGKGKAKPGGKAPKEPEVASSTAGADPEEPEVASHADGAEPEEPEVASHADGAEPGESVDKKLHASKKAGEE